MAVILAALALVPWLTSVPSAARVRALAASVVTAAVVAMPQVLPMVLQAGWRRGTGRLGLLWLASALLALGPTLYVAGHRFVPLPGTWHGARVSLLMPYTWFVQLPGLSAFREADRLAFLGLAAAALLAGAAIEWLRGHAKPLLAVAVVLGALEAGWPASPQQRTMPTTVTALDAR
jgi:hypothetical protein